MILPYEELLLALYLPVTVVVAQIAHATSRRYATYLKVRCITRIAKMVVASEEPEDWEMRSLRISYGAKIVTEGANFVVDNIYGDALCRVNLILEVCEVGDGYDWNEIGEVVEAVNGYPDSAIPYIARLSHPLSWYEVALLSQRLRRSGVPIAYSLLLTSSSRNLQLIGIYICDSLSIIDAEAHLQKLCNSEDGEVARAALYTICTIRGDIITPEVKEAVSNLAPCQRSSLLRHILFSCYSLRSCHPLLSHEERVRFKQRLSTYKCQILCN